MRSARLLFAAAAVLVLVAGVATPEAWAKKLSETAVFIEINDTDGDAGIQLFLDGVGWKRMKLFNPDGKKLFDIRARGGVGIQGLTEAFFESAEPSFEEQPLDEFLALFPEGIYRYSGVTTEGVELKGKARLTHALPVAPLLVFPVEEDVDPEDAEFVWELVADPPGSEIVLYEIVVECEEPGLRAFTAEVGPTVDSITVPPEFLEGGDECKWEVLAIEKSGNKTISEAEFGID